MSHTSLLRPGALVVAVAAFMSLTGCSSSSSPSSSTTTPAVTMSSTTSPAGVSPSTALGGLSGKWAGSYSGQDHGTFKLTWVEKDGKLVGTIDISQLGTVPLNGQVTGSSITFGTVGSTPVTYKGSVSGDSMSGTYYVSGVKQGDWSAHRS